MNNFEISIDQLPPNFTASDIIMENDDRNDPFIEFEITNNGNTEYLEIDAQIRFYDANDKFLGMESGDLLESIQSKQSWAFSIYSKPRKNTKYAKVSVVAAKDITETELYSEYIKLIKPNKTNLPSYIMLGCLIAYVAYRSYIA